MKRLGMISILMIGALVVGCAADPVALDLTRYVNQGVLQIAELERKSLEQYAAVTGPNYKSDEEVYATLQNWVIPLYTRFLQELRKIRPETQEVRELHRTYILGAESLLDGFKLLMLAIELKDPSLIKAVNEKLEKGRVENERWSREMAFLYEKHGLRPEKEKGYTESVLDVLFGRGAGQM
jgi:hypothetical protein